jgi:hypothetical protein
MVLFKKGSTMADNGNPEYGDMLGNLPLRGYKVN